MSADVVASSVSELRSPALLVLAVGLSIALAGCLTSDAGSTEDTSLAFADPYVAQIPEDGSPSVPFEARVAVGDEVVVVAREAGPFVASEAGQRQASIVLSAVDGEGERVHRETTNLTIDQRTAKAFKMVWDTEGVETGVYQLQVEVVDRVAGDRAAKTTPIEVVERIDRSRDAFGAHGWGFFLGQSGDLQLVPEAVVPNATEPKIGLVGVGPFEEGEDGDHHPAADIRVTGADGSTVLEEEVAFPPQRAPEGVFEILYVGMGIPAEDRPGRYTVSLTMEDTVSGRAFETTRTFQIVEG